MAENNGMVPLGATMSGLTAKGPADFETTTGLTFRPPELPAEEAAAFMPRPSSTGWTDNEPRGQTIVPEETLPLETTYKRTFPAGAGGSVPPTASSAQVDSAYAKAGKSTRLGSDDVDFVTTNQLFASPMPACEESPPPSPGPSKPYTSGFTQNAMDSAAGFPVHAPQIERLSTSLRMFQNPHQSRAEASTTVSNGIASGYARAVIPPSALAHKVAKGAAAHPSVQKLLEKRDPFAYGSCTFKIGH
jgi:hypothetical protein